MSDIIFPRPASRARLKLQLALLATVVAALFAASTLWLGLSFLGQAGGGVKVSAQVASLGDSLGMGSSVKFRGLKIGRVVAVDDTPDTRGLYTVKISIDADAEQVPADAVARVLPGTIFGAEYVDLNPSPRSTATPVRSGGLLAADTSTQSLQLMDTLSATQRVLAAVNPAAMNQMLSEFAAALDGKGGNLRRFIERANSELATVHGAEPLLYEDLDLIDRNLSTLSEIEPQVAQTLRNSIPTAQLISQKSAEVHDLLAAGITLTSHVGTFLDQHGQQLVTFLNAVAPTYRAFVGGIAPFSAILQLAPTLLSNGAKAIKDGAIQMMAYFDTARPPNYTSKDCPRYGSISGSNCR